MDDPGYPDHWVGSLIQSDHLGHSDYRSDHLSSEGVISGLHGSYHPGHLDHRPDHLSSKHVFFFFFNVLSRFRMFRRSDGHGALMSFVEDFKMSLLVMFLGQL